MGNRVATASRRIHFVDGEHSEVMHRPLRSLIEANFDVVYDPDKPEIVVCGPRPGHEVLRYSEAVRIYAHGENMYPDLNIYDYSFGYLTIDLLDRYRRIPIYALWDTYQYMVENDRGFYEDPKTRFCAYIYSNTEWADPRRREFFSHLSKYKFVDAPGVCCHNTRPLPVPTAVFFEDNDSYNAKIQYLRQFKFCIAFENHAMPGYTTEKLTDALYAGTIPIYWGDPRVGDEFNTKRFINVRDFGDWDEVIKHIIKIDNDESLYKTIVSEPIFAPNSPSFSEQDIVEFLQPVFEDPVIRRDLFCWGKIYETRLRRWVDEALTIEEIERQLCLYQGGAKAKVNALVNELQILAADNDRLKDVNRTLRKRIDAAAARGFLSQLSRLLRRTGYS